MCLHISINEQRESCTLQCKVRFYIINIQIPEQNGKSRAEHVQRPTMYDIQQRAKDERRERARRSIGGAQKEQAAGAKRQVQAGRQPVKNVRRAENRRQNNNTKLLRDFIFIVISCIAIACVANIIEGWRPVTPQRSPPHQPLALLQRVSRETSGQNRC